MSNTDPATRKIERVGHRPRGSGASTVRITEPTDKQSGRLYIGRLLWQQLGEPERVSLETLGVRLLIKPGDLSDFAVSGHASNSIPRVSLGRATMEQIGYEAGIYPAHVVAEQQAIVVDAP